jgi:phosphatidylserine decarboxylase
VLRARSGHAGLDIDPHLPKTAQRRMLYSQRSDAVVVPGHPPGAHVGKGEELGYFQFGGSTHCLVLRPDVLADFSLGALPQPHDPEAPLVLVRSRLATARATT